MPRIDPNDYFNDEEPLEILEDDKVDRRGRKLPPPKPTKLDLSWEENRKILQNRRARRSEDY